MKIVLRVSGPSRMYSARQKGFTLVEIAIVLVVIGLLIGGILKSREMIVNSNLKRMNRDRQGIVTALQAYQDRYRVLPGDDSLASARFSVYNDGINDPVAIDGDADGSIDGDWIAAADTETANFWKHLRASGLVAGSADDDTQPTNAYGGIIGIRDGSLSLSGHVIIFGSVEGQVARVLEAQIDDESPSTGLVQSDFAAAQMNGTLASTAGNDYQDELRYFMAFRI